MNVQISTWQELEVLLKELERGLPPGVHFLGPFMGNDSRICECSEDDGPSGWPSNPLEGAPGIDYPARPIVIGVELFMPTRKWWGWIYAVHFVIDQLLCSDEVRIKTHSACSILLAHRETRADSRLIDERPNSGLIQKSTKEKKVIRVN
ncbi:MAG: hypothetical protein WA755_17635 [Candidatus Acidiferrales bacterium]